MVDPHQCSECGGKLMHGALLHRFTSTNNGTTTVLYWCIECAEYISSASWDYEERGPYRFTVTSNLTGHA